MDPLLRAVRHVEDILAGEMRTRSLLNAQKLGVFACLAEGGKSLEEIAGCLAIDNRAALSKLMDTLAGLGLVRRKQDQYENSLIARRTLVPGCAGYFGHFVDFLGDQYAAKSREGILENLRSGLPLRPELTPAEWQAYMAAMECIARLSADRIARCLDLSSARNLLDLGAGPGQYAIAFCQAWPKLIVTLYDLPQSLETAERNIAGAGVGRQTRLVAGSATDTSFGGGFDVVFISHTIHLFDPEAAGRMLLAAASALKEGGTLVVRDFIMNRSRTEPLLGSLISLNMWLEGAAYSLDQIRSWMGSVGLSSIRRIRLSDPSEAQVVGALVAGRKLSRKRRG